MKRKMTILLGSLSIIFGGSVAKITPTPTINSSPSLHQIAAENLRFDRVKLPSTASTSSDFNFSDLVVDGIKRGGANLIGFAIGSLGSLAFNSLLTSMGVDMRSAADKKIDQIADQLTTLQQSLQQGLIDVKRKIEHLHNEDIMEKLLEKFAAIQTPVTSKLATLADLARKEVSGCDKKALESEKETFYKSLADLKFTSLNANSLWNAAENLAKAVLVPYNIDQSLTLFKLYEDTYGAGETWDYTTIEPRVRFIGYLGTLVNSLTQLAQIRACYEMSKYKEGDSILIDYKTGVKAMIDAANQMNGKFKEILDSLEVIQRKHDEQHLITHRDMVIDKDGGLSFKDGKTVSTRLFAVSTADNDTNYLCYKHNEKNPFVRYDTGAGAMIPVYANFVYTMDCTQMDDLYKAVMDEYAAFNGAASVKVSMQDYLLKIGFSCEEKDMFTKAKGFYRNITHDNCKGSESSWWTTDDHNQLRVHYYDFTSGKEQSVTYSDTRVYCKGWFSTNKYYGNTTNQLNNIYLMFLNADQKTLEGKVVKTDVEYTNGETYSGNFYQRHYKGYKNYSSDTIKIS